MVADEWVLDFLFRWLQQSHPLHETRPGVHRLHQRVFHRCKLVAGESPRWCCCTDNADRVLFAQGYRQKDYFIATQGPLTHTVDDFWRMVWEWKCHSIVMLTELQEREQVSRRRCWSWSHGRLWISTCLIRRFGVAGQMLPVLARRGLCCLRRLQGGAQRRHFVWRVQFTRLGTDICAGKKIHSAPTHL